MAVFAVYIEKETAYFGAVVKFGNTYHYETTPGQTFNDETIATEVATAEQQVTQANVSFVGWKTWGPTDGTKLANIIRASGEFNFNGFSATNTSLYKEACALVVWEISRSPVLNRRRWLRKFLRCPSSPGGSLTAASVSGSDPIGSTIQQALVDYGNAVKNVGPATDPLTLCTEAGDQVPIGTDAQVRPYLFTRQIGV